VGYLDYLSKKNKKIQLERIKTKIFFYFGTKQNKMQVERRKKKIFFYFGPDEKQNKKCK